jgi:hypothetical protein
MKAPNPFKLKSFFDKHDYMVQLQELEQWKNT